MAADLYLTSDGDIMADVGGDIAVTPTVARHFVQQAYIRIMTDVGDWTTYPNLGASLSELYGMPQSKETGDFGVTLITNALEREGVFAGRKYRVQAIPTGPQSIRFDVFVISDTGENVRVSVEQNLTISY